MKPVIIACDFENKEQFMEFIKHFPDEKPSLKIGMELFYQEGPKIVKDMKQQGFPVFLDLKLNDIPNTVEKAMYNIGRLGVDMINVHANGGLAMMKAAKQGLLRSGSKAKLIAVTVLTSIDDTILHQELLVFSSINNAIIKYAELAKEAGLDGVVCSPLEVPMIHKICGEKFITVTPGIRLSEQQSDDQKRITTPKMAYELGSDYIVVGRSITKAKDPLLVYHQIMEDMNCGN
ncbi:MAG: orotidine-5'-phosphate decarboxylase [Candidatus Izemoplasmatales bacterium]|jgi:orotidine-5'-phosphate decarboxylase|nr:orotidine-5'-phosphate decarboxylase [Candidatus Izemoplasmatales bacterium]MDD3865099.1 orotidine-5'-phosphate decarboxylase [Candidatus Izemoplasmatales bacterium]